MTRARTRVFRTDGLLRHLLPRVARLGIKVGLRIIGSVRTGSIYDGTCVMNADDVDILVMFDAYQVDYYAIIYPDSDSW